MQWDLKHLYILSCNACQCNKFSTRKLPGLLHFLSVSDKCCDSIAIDFIGPLSEDEGYNFLIIITDHLDSNIQLIPSQTNFTTEQLTKLFFKHWYCENKLLLDIISNCNKLFISYFWKALYFLTSIKLKILTLFYS